MHSRLVLTIHESDLVFADQVRRYSHSFPVSSFPQIPLKHLALTVYYGSK